MRLIIMGISLFLLSSCSVKLADYANKSPKLDFAQFFSGALCAKGVVRERSGLVTRKFIADIQAVSENNKVTLDEKFVFDDGEQQARLWQFNQNNNIWTGIAGDVVGEAKGEVSGDTMELNYELKILVDGTERIVQMQDWLHLIDESTLMGTTQITKWGLNVGRIDIVIQKTEGVVYACNASENNSSITD